MIEIELPSTSTDKLNLLIFSLGLSDEAKLKSEGSHEHFVMTCVGNSTSIMPVNIPYNVKPKITFHWIVDRRFKPNHSRYSISGPTNEKITLTHVESFNHYLLFECVAQETGSPYTTSFRACKYLEMYNALLELC